MLRALFGQRGKGFHQSALAARDGVLVQNSLFRRLVQNADRGHDRGFGFGRVFGNGFARGIIGSAGGAADVAVAQATLFVLTIAFDLGLNVSQVFLQKFRALLFTTGRYST